MKPLRTQFANAEPATNSSKIAAIILFLTTIFSTQTFAFTCQVFATRIEVGVGEIKPEQINDICLQEISQNKRLGTVILLNSPGGLIAAIPDVLSGIEAVVSSSVKWSKKKPAVIVHEKCASACIPILAAINHMAEQGLLDLVVDSKTKIQFHGASVVRQVKVGDKTERQREHSQLATVEYLHLLAVNGADFGWIVDHASYFDSQELTTMAPQDLRMAGSNILSNAKVQNTDFIFYGYPTFDLKQANYRE